MSGLIFLPDRDGADKLTAGTGIVRMDGGDQNSLRWLGDRLAVQEKALQQDSEAVAAWRGALALALLLDTWQGVQTRLDVMTVDADTSPFAALVMAARPPQERGEPVRLLLLEKDGERRVLGVVSRRRGLTLAADPAPLSDMMPRRMMWYDREAERFLDPVPLMNERDRMRLIRRLHMMQLPENDAAVFAAELGKAGLAESQALTHQDAAALDALTLRARAAIGLTGEPFPPLTVETEAYQALSVNPLLRLFSTALETVEDNLPEQRLWCWQGIPFARTSAITGLTGTNHPRESEALEALRTELELLEEGSRRWQRDAGERLRTWLQTLEGRRGYLPAARLQLEGLCRALEEGGRQPQSTVVLNWPWDEASCAIRLLKQEALGDALMFEGSPFPDRLTRIRDAADALGDAALRMSCCIGAAGYLPPVSESLAGCLYHAPEGQGLVTDQMYLLLEEGGVTASFLLRGVGEAAVVRHYDESEIVTLEREQAPTVAVWPCMPAADDSWKAYFVYLRGENFTVRALSGGQWTDCPVTEEGFCVLQTETYPACLTVYRDGLCLGALPNVLPKQSLARLGPATIALDVGATGTAVVISMGETPLPMQLPCLVRTLLSTQEQPPYEEEFLPAMELGPVFPTCAAVSGEGRSVLSDGRAYDPANLGSVTACEQTLMTGSLKWRSDSAALRGREMLLHQTMLYACLAATLRGASSVTWRMALPDGTGDTTRKAWLDMVVGLCGRVAEETGLPLTTGLPPVRWLTASQALGIQMREGVIRGSFVALDFGGGSTSLNVWLRAMNRPSAGCSLHGGMQALLLGVLADCPDLLYDTFFDCTDELLRQAVRVMAAHLQKAQAGLQQMDRAMLLLDLLLDRHGTALCTHLNACYAAGRMTYLQALLLEHFAALMLLTGLALEQLGQDTMLNHLLPAELTVCLSGRGSLLLQALPDPLRNGLARFVRVVMREGHPVQSLLLYQSVSPKLDVCLGLCAAPHLSQGIEREEPVPVIEHAASFAALVMRFLLLMRACYPEVCDRLHPEMFSQQGLLTVQGEDAVRRAAAAHYGDGGDIPAALMATLADLRQAAELRGTT